MTSFLVFCFGSDDFISVYADSFFVKASPFPDQLNIWFETSTDYVACFPLSLVHQIQVSDSKCDHRLVFDNVRKLSGCDYKIFD